MNWTRDGDDASRGVHNHDHNAQTEIETETEESRHLGKTNRVVARAATGESNRRIREEGRQ